jgi:hypothetical protein
MLLWVCWLITRTTAAVFDGGDISGPEAAAYGTCTALLTAVIGFYFHARHKSDDDKT